MQLEQQVISLELAKQLKEAGVPQESLFHRDKTGNIFPEYNWTDVQESDPESYGIIKENWYSAFTASELGELLPQNRIRIAKWFRYWFCEMYKEGETPLGDAIKRFTAFNMAEAMGQMLLYLINQKLIDPKSL